MKVHFLAHAIVVIKRASTETCALMKMNVLRGLICAVNMGTKVPKHHFGPNHNVL